MVGINTSMGATAYVKTAQLGGAGGNANAERLREAQLKNSQQREDATAKAADMANKKRDALSDKLDLAKDTQPPKAAAQEQSTERRGAPAPRGSIVDIAV